jgi:hypothetical protein
MKFFLPDEGFFEFFQKNLCGQKKSGLKSGKKNQMKNDFQISMST